MKKKIPITSSFIIVSCPWFLLFCFVLYHQSCRSTYTRAFKNIVAFGLKNWGRIIHESTYTWEIMVVAIKHHWMLLEFYETIKSQGFSFFMFACTIDYFLFKITYPSKIERSCFFQLVKILLLSFLLFVKGWTAHSRQWFDHLQPPAHSS